MFTIPYFQQRWAKFLSLGCSWEWPDYKPHITIARSENKEKPYKFSLKETKKINFPLLFGPEEIKEIEKDI